MSTSTGNQAETAAVDFLKYNKFKIIDRNWRTRVCEIDIIAKKKKVIYFVEVKYRSTSNQGGGLEYITPKKLEQMQFAAACWVQENKYTGLYELSGIEVSADFEVTEFLETID